MSANSRPAHIEIDDRRRRTLDKLDCSPLPAVVPGPGITSPARRRSRMSLSLRRGLRQRPRWNHHRLWRAPTALSTDGYAAARACALTQLAVLKRELGSLDLRCRESSPLSGYVNAIPAFEEFAGRHQRRIGSAASRPRRRSPATATRLPSASALCPGMLWWKCR